MNVGIIIFSWKNPNKTKNAKEKLLKIKHPKINFKVICVYNGIGESYVNENGNLIEIGFVKHVGFGLSSKKVFDLYSNDFDYFIRNDNDFLIHKFEMIYSMLDYISIKKDIGILTCKILHTDRSLNCGAIKYNFYGLKSKIFDSKTIIDTDTFLGAFFIVSTKSLKTIGRFFDPEIILFGEELELSLALKRSGFRVVYYPKAIGTHECGATINKSYSMYDILEHTNQYYIFSKYFNIFSRLSFIFFQAVRLLKNINLFNFMLFIRLIKKQKVSIEEWNKFLDEIK